MSRPRPGVSVEALQSYVATAVGVLHEAEEAASRVRARVRAQGTARGSDVEELADLVGRVAVIAANMGMMVAAAMEPEKTGLRPQRNPRARR